VKLYIWNILIVIVCLLPNGESLTSWKNVYVLSIRAYYDKGGKLLGSRSWAGALPVFRKMSRKEAETA
jgi:hypothetical protein